MNWKNSIRTKIFDPDGLTTKTITPGKIVTYGTRAMRNDRFSLQFIVAIRSPIRPCPIAITKALLSQAQVTGSYPSTTFESLSPSKQAEWQGLLLPVEVYNAKLDATIVIAMNSKKKVKGEQGINVLLCDISKILFPNNPVNVPVIK